VYWQLHWDALCLNSCIWIRGAVACVVLMVSALIPSIRKTHAASRRLIIWHPSSGVYMSLQLFPDAQYTGVLCLNTHHHGSCLWILHAMVSCVQFREVASRTSQLSGAFRCSEHNFFSFLMGLWGGCLAIVRSEANRSTNSLYYLGTIPLLSTSSTPWVLMPTTPKKPTVS